MMLKHRMTVAVALLLLVLPCSAQTPPRHEVRLGWGDMLFETMVFHASSTHAYPAGKPTDYLYKENRDYGYTGHFFAEYRYHFSKLFSLGLQADFEGILETVYSQGDEEWVFPRDDAGMPEGQNWYLILAGYQDGDLNSDETLVKFTWSPGESHIVEVIYD